MQQFFSEKFLMVWLFVSAIVYFGGSFVFWIFLLRRGVKMIFSFTGTPGYFDFVYIQDCHKNKKKINSSLIAFRVFSFLNAILAIIFALIYLK